MKEEESLGTIIVDGKLINLDSIPLEELTKIREKKQKEVEELEKDIMDYIKQDN
ncbi:MAG: hypothetical protein IKD76_02855 [Clostridia bacterium]|nr:hypothetical protein [Clostridia bacterium]